MKQKLVMQLQAVHCSTSAGLVLRWQVSSLWKSPPQVSTSRFKMKILAIVSTIVATRMCLLAAQTLDNSTATADSCYVPCEGVDEYCESSTGLCRGPNYDGECFNPATGGFQDGCDPGFECVSNKCDYEGVVGVESVEADSNSEEGCGLQCDVAGEFCDSTTNECRAPAYEGECFNADAGFFQDGCEDGYTCLDSVCQLAVVAPPPESEVCYLICSAGNYCETGTEECRGPDYDGECFNPATGTFQNGCDPGFTCSSNKCVYA